VIFACFYEITLLITKRLPVTSFRGPETPILSPPEKAYRKSLKSLRNAAYDMSLGVNNLNMYLFSTACNKGEPWIKSPNSGKVNFYYGFQ
jgi:hypothetical protein